MCLPDTPLPEAMFKFYFFPTDFFVPKNLQHFQEFRDRRERFYRFLVRPFADPSPSGFPFFLYPDPPRRTKENPSIQPSGPSANFPRRHIRRRDLRAGFGRGHPHWRSEVFIRL